MPRVSPVLLLAALLASMPPGLAAQTSHRPQLSIGLGRGVVSWSGPYIASSNAGSSANLGITVPVRSGWAVRGELSSQSVSADLTYQSFGVDRAELISQQFGTAMFARRYFTPDTSRNTWYVDAGAVVRQQTCDVDETGGLASVGFLGGVTKDCRDHEDANGNRRLAEVGNSIAPILAIGAQSRRLGVQLRIDPLGSSVAKSTAGTLRARSASVMVEWHTRRR